MSFCHTLKHNYKDLTNFYWDFAIVISIEINRGHVQPLVKYTRSFIVCRNESDIHIFDRICFSRYFLELNIYMRDLRVQEYEQLEAYTLVDLLSKANLHC